MKTFLYLSSVLIISVSFLLSSSGDSFPLTLLFGIIPIIITGYLYGPVWAWALSIILSIVTIALSKLGPLSWPIVLSIVNFNIAPIFVNRFRAILLANDEQCTKTITQAQDFYNDMLKQDEQAKEFNARLEKDVLEMARLYEITKAMSASLEFAGVFSVFKNILEKSFKFRSARLILITQKPALNRSEAAGSGQGQDIYMAQKTYIIESISQAQQIEEKNFVRLSTSPGLFLDSSASGKFSEEGGIAKPDDFDNALAAFYPAQGRVPITTGLNQSEPFIAVGLFFQDKPVGILSISNITENQMERFLIVASQFELELQKVKLYEIVQQLAIMDGLTDVFVRRHLLERCQDELRRAMKHKLNLSCLIADIDFFKDCNDKYGHLVGDAVLKQLAVIIKESIREVDFAGRYGGEEFCIILPDTPRDGALHVAERLRSAVEQYNFRAYDENIKITVSIGVTVFPDDASDLNQLIDRADQAMYRAKEGGRNKVCTYS